MKHGWEIKKLEEICLTFTDGDWIESKDQSPLGIRLIQTGNVGNGYFKDREEKARYISEDTFNQLKCTEIFENDCLISRLPDPVGRACVIPKLNDRMITAVDCSIIRFKQNIVLSKWFLYYSMSNNYQQQINSQISGATRQRISRKNLGSIWLPIPSLQEQGRIVSILDKAFSAIEQAKQNAEKNLKNAKELFDSYLNSIFTEKGDNWEEKKLGEVCEFIQGLQVEIQKQYDTKNENQIRFLRIIDFTQGTEPPRYIDNPGNKYIVNEEDVSLVRYGASTGFVCSGLSGVLANNLFRVIPNNHIKINNLFLYFFLTSSFFQHPIKKNMNGAAMPAISFGMIKDVSFPIPPIPEQEKIVEKLNALSAKTKQLEVIYQQKLVKLENFKKSILQKAFNGELIYNI